MPSPPTAGLEGVILAAGRGTRMMPFSERYPKPLLPILNKPLIQSHIEYLRDFGVRKIFVVIGHLGHEIALELRRGEELGVQIEYVEQRDSMGIAHALMQLEKRVHGPFILLLGDIYFDADRSINPFSLMEDRGADGLLAVMREPNPKAIQRNFAVQMDEEQVVIRVVEKPRFPRSEWKGCGIYAFNPTIFDAIRRTPRTANRNEYELTDSIQAFIDDGAKVIACPLVTFDINLTYPYDLLIANLRALRSAQKENFVAPDARLHSGVTLSNCIVGARTAVTSAVRLYRSLMLPDAILPAADHIDRAVITADRVVDCRFWVDENGRAIGDGNQDQG